MQLAKLQKSYDAVAQHLGVEREVAKSLHRDLQQLRTKVQSSKPVLMHVQSLQSHLQQLEGNLLRAHEEYEACEDELLRLPSKLEQICRASLWLRRGTRRRRRLLD